MSSKKSPVCRTNRKIKQLRRRGLTVVWLTLEVLFVVDNIPAILYLFSPVALSTMSPTRPVYRERWHSHVVLVETQPRQYGTILAKLSSKRSRTGLFLAYSFTTTQFQSRLTGGLSIRYLLLVSKELTSVSAISKELQANDGRNHALETNSIIVHQQLINVKHFCVSK